MESARASRIQFKREEIDIKRKENHDEAYKWLLNHSIELYNSVKKIIK
jgi:hypothetical protein